MDENTLAKYRRKQVGFVFQSFNLVPSLNALENVCLPMVFDEVSPGERQERAASMLRQVGLSDRSLHFPNQLSGGQQQRVAIARALVNMPLLVLCDEPTGNLDSTSGIVIMELLASLRKSGCTLVVVTHDPRMQQFASQIIYILDGRVVSEADYAENASTSASVTGKSREL
jgi:putative ABC transport system ATP-binding protein